MARKCQWPAPDTTVEQGPHTFSPFGTIAGVRDTTPADDLHPALMLVVELGDEFARILVPPAVWPTAPDLLPIGGRVRVDGETDSHILLTGSRQIATEVALVVRRH